MDELQKTFRQEVERALDERWLTSSLAQWMDSNHGEAAALLGHERMDWEMAAAALGAHGLKDHAGRPPSAAIARETWLQVEARRRVGMMFRETNGEVTSIKRAQP
ncbi:hypothetical protein [Plastoroseomonas arctica]|uniref:Uncharacterized protein n=1 Tax=Plastoroseomonas arctica TaxID=1509237 RepID=A0AAF1JVD6_9PROT|nr:hypothetical protein [Plastoroseomonas arctica]MBR0653663.1 hypothetical protein [Plastoroseomonas arctica]